MKSLDISAKLLAQENITIVRANAKTASFDIVNRILTIPLWKDMTLEIEDMLQCHEVGHALFTNANVWTNTLNALDEKKKSIFRGYLNVVEDARIEKLMKRRYPGTRKSFYSAYSQLNDRDFFKLKGRDVNTLLLIDRINLHFKGGSSLGVIFSEEEKMFVDEIDRLETIEEVVDIANRIYDFSKTNHKDSSAETWSDDSFDEVDEYDATDEDDDSAVKDSNDEFESDQLSNENCSTKNTSTSDFCDDDQLRSETEKNLDEYLQELADTDTKYVYYEFFTKLSHDPIVSYKTIIDETKSVDEKLNRDQENAVDDSKSHNELFNTFMVESKRVVNYLVKEFEMRKSAQAHKRSSIAKSGSLNLNKIYAHGLTDDIFRRITTVANGKNHGMIFLLDWSGSMHSVMYQTMLQVINLAMFCRRINIPFEVYAFTSEYFKTLENKKLERNSDFFYAVHSQSENYLFSNGAFNLLNIFSSKMSSSEFTTIARRFTSRDIRNVRGYSLGCTPFNDALIHFLELVPSYISRNNIEKMTMITLSDGQSNELYSTKSYMSAHELSSDSRRSISVKYFVRDPKTKKTYNISHTSQSQTEVLLRMIKDRYEISSLGFYICNDRSRLLACAYKDNLGYSAKSADIEEMRAAFAKSGFYSMHGTGRDELFIVPHASTEIVDYELEVNTTHTAASIAKKFSKQLGAKKHSRMLLDKFISYVA